MLSKIPPWAVAVAGAAIAIAATLTSSTLLYQTRSEVSAEQSMIREDRGRVDRLWASHVQADQRSTAANVFLGQALETGSNQQFLLDQVAKQLLSAVLSMWAASGEPVPEAQPEPIAEAEQQLRNGNADGYATLMQEIDRLRILSQSHIETLGDDIRAAEARIDALQDRELWLYLAYVFSNVLALVVTMCKDLPVWGGKRHRVRSGTDLG